MNKVFPLYNELQYSVKMNKLDLYATLRMNLINIIYNKRGKTE